MNGDEGIDFDYLERRVMAAPGYASSPELRRLAKRVRDAKHAHQRHMRGHERHMANMRRKAGEFIADLEAAER